MVCFVRAKVRLALAKFWTDVLDARKNRQNECLGFESVTTFASFDIND